MLEDSRRNLEIYAQSESDLKIKLQKLEHGTEKVTKNSKEKVKQQENLLKSKENEIEDLKIKLTNLEHEKDILMLDSNKSRKIVKDRENERNFIEKEREIKKLIMEAADLRKHNEQLEFLNQQHIEAYSGSIMEKKDLEIEDLKRKNADLVAMKMKLMKDIDELRNNLNETAEKCNELEQVNEKLGLKLKNAPKEFQYEMHQIVFFC